MAENAVLGLVLVTAGTSYIERWFVIVNEESKNEWIIYELQHEISSNVVVHSAKISLCICAED